jgi:hypothetical protein
MIDYCKRKVKLKKSKGEYKMLSELNFNIDTDLISKVLKKNWFEE